MFLGVDWELFADVSEQPTLKNIAVTAIPLKMGCPESSLINYKYTPRNILKERKSHLYSGGSLILRNLTYV